MDECRFRWFPKATTGEVDSVNNTVECDYLDTANYIVKCATVKQNRTGVDTISIFNKSYETEVSFDRFPILTTKKVNFKSIVAELIWFIRGENNVRNLEKYTKIWSDWADDEGNLEFAYGRYWRHYPLPTTDSLNKPIGKIVYSVEAEAFVGNSNQYCQWKPSTELWTFDQLRWLVDEIKSNPNSRRLVLTAWYPPNACVAKLPPCHLMAIFNVQDGKLNCHLTQRSGDFCLGIPYNLSSYSLLILLIAQETGLKPGIFAHTIVDAHIYLNHVDGIKTQLQRQPYNLPSVRIPNKSLFDLTYDDIDSFELIDYKHHPAIKFEVAV